MPNLMAMSIIGMYNYDEDVFNGFNVPEGMDRTSCIYEILMQCGELELIYQDWDLMQTAITAWSLMNLPVWQKLYDTTQLEYNPIWNVDADITDTETRNLAGTDDSTKSTSDKTTEAGGTVASVEHDVMGYNVSSGYQHESKDSSTSETHDTITGTGSETDKRNTTDTGTITHVTRRTGNIGVTTSQQMIREEREIDRFNVYDEIVGDFKRRFCVMVY